MHSSRYFPTLKTVCAAAALTVLAGCGSDSDETAPGSRTNSQSSASSTPILGNLEVLVVRSNELASTIPLAGTVISRHTITVSASVPGRVVYLAGPEGTEVGPRELLFGLDDEALIARQRAAWAGLSKAVAALQDSHVQLGRELYSDGYSARGGMGLPALMDKFMTEPMAGIAGVGNPVLDRQAEVNHSRVGVEQAQAAVVEAQSGLDELESALRDKTAVAPGSAVIIEKFAEVGEYVQPGQPVLRIADTDDLQIRLELPTRLLMGLSQGMTIPVKIDATDAFVNTVLEQIFPAANPQQQTVTVKLKLPPDSPAAVGMYATIMIPNAGAPTVALPSVPQRAVVWRGSQPSVFVVNSTNHAEMRLVRLGDASGESIVILSGLYEGERVLASPPAMVQSGMPIAFGMTPTTQNNYIQRLDGDSR